MVGGLKSCVVICLSITNILTQTMQNQPYMLFLAPLAPTILPLSLQAAPGTFISPLPHPQPSTSPHPFPNNQPQNGFYSLSYTSFTLTFNPMLSQEPQPNLNLPQIIQNQEHTVNTPASSNTLTTSQPHFPLTDSSIKIEESPSAQTPSSGYKKRSHSHKAASNVDQEYNPHRPQRLTVRKRLHQNENRNVVPNQINQILSFIQKPSKSAHLVARLLAQHPEGQNYTIQRFYLYQGLLREQVSHYTTERSLRLISQLYEPEGRIWPLAEQRYYTRLCRLLVRHFLLEDSIFIILTSRRMKSEKKIEHLRARRKVAQRVMEILRGG